MTDSPRSSTRGLSRGFLALAGVTWTLIVLGALVRAHGAGLACPDWPLCFGEVIPTFDMGVAFEWGHRALAGSVSIGLAVLTFFVWRRPDLSRMLRGRLLVAWTLLAIQVVFGGLTVLLLLAPWTVTVHLLLGNSFCAVVLWISRDLADFDAAPARAEISRSAVAWVALTVTSFVVQMILGGMVSSHYAGLACGSFPTCNGEQIAPTFSGLVGLHVLHRLNAFLLLGSFVALAWVARATPRVARLARTCLRLVLLQIAVGVANVLMLIPVEVTGLHSALAALIFLCTTLLAREALLARTEAARSASASEGRVAEAR